MKPNVKLDPPLLVASTGAPEPPTLYVGVPKSPTRPVVGPLPPIVVIVHDISSLTRTTVFSPLTCPLHVSDDPTVGDPTTANENGLPPITEPDPPDRLSVMYSTVSVDDDAVKKNENCVPPPIDASPTAPTPPPLV